MEKFHFPRPKLSLAWPVGVLLFILLALASCSSGPADPTATAVSQASFTELANGERNSVPTHPTSQTGGTLRIGQSADPASCDLHSARALSYQAVHPCNPMLSQLIRASADDHGKIEPDLAIAWSVSDDGTRWTFDMRDGVRWHDGTDFSVADAVFSLRRAIDLPPGIAPGRASAIARYISDLDQIREEDGKLVIETDFPAASFLPNLASVYVSIYPERATLALDPPSMTAFETVIGTGPFEAGGTVRGSRYQLVRNDDYYLEGLPYLDGVEFHIIPETAVRLAALRSHQIDTIAIITEAEAQSLEQDFAGQITVFRSPSAGGNTVQMNLNRPPFDDPRVRRAVNLAISRSDAELALGQGFKGAILPPGGSYLLSESEIDELPGYGDVEENRRLAKQLLADAGYPDGFPAVLNTRANFFFQLLSDFAAGQLAEIGIRAEVVPLEAVDYQDRIMKGDFDMIGHSHSFALDDPDSVLPSHYACGGEENYPGSCDEEIDGLIEQQSRELDSEERALLLNRIERIIWEQDAKIWFQWSSRRTPVWNDVIGLKPGGPSVYQGRRLDQVFKVTEN